MHQIAVMSPPGKKTRSSSSPNHSVRVSNNWTLSSFLNESSLPGVKYLASGRQHGSFARLLWTACVLASAGGAACIIYLNVTEWRDSPVLVSEVTSGRLKESPFTKIKILQSIHSPSAVLV